MSIEPETRSSLVANPFATDTERAARVELNGALVAIEQQREIARIQARMIFSRERPRDPMLATERILNECTRKTLAEQATYTYNRGGRDVHGPSIRLAEVIARNWGNFDAGIKVLSRANGHSECVAYAWDLETNYYNERQFQVRHWRDRKIKRKNEKTGQEETIDAGYVLTDERDIWELEANMGARRVRSAILAVIPGDVVEAALEQVEKTLHQHADTSLDALQKMLARFSEFGITRQHIERRLGKRLEAIRPAQVIDLHHIYTSLKDGMSEPTDWFEGVTAPVETKPETTQEPKKPAASAKPRSAPRPEPKPAPEPPKTTVEPPTTDTPNDVEFDAQVLDQGGDGLNEGAVYTDATQWCEVYGKLLDSAFPADLDAIVANNIDTVRYIAREIPDVLRRFPDIKARHPHLASEVPAYTPVAVPMRGSAGSQRDLVGYLRAIEASLKREVTDAPSAVAWRERNEQTIRWLPQVTRSGVEERMRVRFAELGMKAPAELDFGGEA